MGGRGVDDLNEHIRELVRERQALREREATSEELERNRLELVRSQWELAYSLGRRDPTDPDEFQAA